jgi:MFS family permease
MTTASVLEPVRQDQGLRAATAVFALNGLIVGAGISRIPAMRDQVGAGPGELGFVLVMVGIGSLIAMPATAWLVRRVGSARVVFWSAAVCGTAWVCAGLSTSVPALGASVFVIGAGVGVWDVAMNVQGYAVERRDGRSRMPWLHAAVSAGVVAGAGLGALSARLDVPLLAQFTVVSVAVVAAVGACVQGFLPDPDRATGDQTRQADDMADTPDDGSGRTPRGSLWLHIPVLALGLLIVSTAFGEGAAGDWLALSMVDTKHATQPLAALGYAGYSAAMLLGRLLGGPAVDRWGRVPVLRSCGACATVGVLLVCLASTLPLVLLGALLWGLGLSVVFPVTMSAAGEAVPGRGAEGVAVVSTIGYVGFLTGPPLLGIVADVVPLDRALLVVAGFAALVMTFAGVTRTRPAVPAPPVREHVGAGT